MRRKVVLGAAIRDSKNENTHALNAAPIRKVAITPMEINRQPLEWVLPRYLVFRDA